MTEIGAFIHALTEDTTPDTAADEVLTYDDSASAVKRVKLSKLAGVSGSVATDSIWAAAGDLVKGTGNDTADVLSKGANNTSLGVNSSGNLAYLGGIQLIEEQVVGAGGVATITIPATGSLPTGFKHLKLVWMIRGEAASAAETLLARFNADSGSNYYSETDTRADAYSGGHSSGATTGRIGTVNCANAPANTASTGETLFPFYTRTVFYKTYITQQYRQDGTDAQSSESSVGRWSNTAAITSITLSLSSGDFAEGSVIALYGLS